MYVTLLQATRGWRFRMRQRRRPQLLPFCRGARSGSRTTLRQAVLTAYPRPYHKPYSPATWWPRLHRRPRQGPLPARPARRRRPWTLSCQGWTPWIS